MTDKTQAALAANLPALPPLPDSSDQGRSAGVAGLATLPAVPSAYDQGVARKAREDKTTNGNYFGAMWRQDGLVDGLMASIVGKEMMVDPAYSPLAEANWKDLSAGVWDEFQPALMQSHSAAHAAYTKDLILQKQDDQTKLNDLGWKGNVGRFAAGAIMPDQLLMAMAGGWVAKGLKVAEVAGQAGRAASRSIVPSVLGGVAFGAAENAAYEKLRQSVNFEDDSTGVMAAALLGGAITAPFAIAGARSQKRITSAASKEHEALNALHDINEGRAPDAAGQKAMADTMKAHEAVRKVETGEATPDEVRKALDEIHGTEDKAFLDQLQQRLATDGQKALDDVFPSRVTDRTAKLFNPDDSPLLLRHDPSVVDGPIHALPVDSAGNVLPSTSPKMIDDELARIAKKRHPKNADKADRWVMDQRAKLLGYDPDHIAAVEAGRVAKRVPTAPETNQRTVAEAFGMADTARTEAIAAKAQVEELKVLVDKGNAPATPGPVKAPEAPTTPLTPTSETTPLPKAPEALVAPRDRSGEYVSWADKEGESQEGIVQGRNSMGNLQVKTREGTMKIVPDHMLDTAMQAGDHAPPEGFLHNSIGAAQHMAIQSVADKTTAMSRGRLDIFAKLNRSESKGVKELVFDLVKDAIQVDDHQSQAMSASEWKSHYRRTIAGGFHVTARQAAADARKVMQVPMWGKYQFNQEFFTLVSRYTRGDDTVLHVNPEMAPMIRTASKAQQDAYKAFLKEAKDAGVKGTEDLDPNGAYVNRIWNHKGISAAINTHGAEAVEDLLARSINVPGHIGDRAKAKSFLNTVRKLEFSPVMQNIHLYAQDMGTLRKALAESGNLNESEIDGLVDLMFTAKEVAGSDAGRQANLKYRFDLEETMGINLKTGVLRISDLLENDARVLVDIYGNSMAGHIGLAKKGITSQADFMERLRGISDEGLKNPQWDTKALGQETKLLQDLYNNITGKPMSTADFSATNRIAQTMRGYTRSVMLGQLGIAAMFEMKQAVATMGFKTFLKQMPALSSMFTAMRNGFIPDVQLARDIEHMAGFGTEMASGYVRAAEIDDGIFGQLLTRAEHGANVTSHAVDILSGNASFTSLTKQLSGMMAAQRMHDFATGLKTLTPDMRKRFVGWGVDDDRLDGMLKFFKDHSTANKGHKLESVNYEKWNELSPNTYQDFQTALSRMVRDAIQDHDLGETMPFMHSTLGKVFAELKTFFLVAHAKNFLKNLHYRDATAFQVWAIGFVGESLAYMTQNAANNLHDPDKMLKGMDPTKIATAAMFRSPALGALPMFVETGYNVATGGESLVSPGMTTNTDSRSFLNPPSLIVAKRLLNAPLTLGGMVTGSSVTTRQEGRDLTGILPGSNLYGVKNLANYLTNSLPVVDPAHRLPN